MNPTIVLLCIAAAGGLLAGLVVLLRRRAVSRDVLAFLVPATPWQRQLAEWNREDAEKRRRREAAQSERSDTLRMRYDAAVAAESQDREEVPAL